MLCRNCNEDKEKHFFKRTWTNGVLYYRKDKCKECRRKEYLLKHPKKVKIIKSKKIKDLVYQKEVDIKFPLPLTRDMKYLLNKIDLRDGELDVVDVYRLTSYYIDVTDDYWSEYDLEYDLNRMYSYMMSLSTRV